jgi:hypothetical protein
MTRQYWQFMNYYLIHPFRLAYTRDYINLNLQNHLNYAYHLLFIVKCAKLTFQCMQNKKKLGHRIASNNCLQINNSVWRKPRNLNFFNLHILFSPPGVIVVQFGLR